MTGTMISKRKRHVLNIGGYVLPVCIDIADMIGKVVTSFSGYDITMQMVMRS